MSEQATTARGPVPHDILTGDDACGGRRYRVSLPADLADRKLIALLVEADDYSLAGRAILPGDLLLLEEDATPVTGDLVAVRHGFVVATDNPRVQAVEPYIALGIYKGAGPGSNYDAVCLAWPGEERVSMWRRGHLALIGVIRAYGVLADRCERTTLIPPDSGDWSAYPVTCTVPCVPAWVLEEEPE